MPHPPKAAKKRPAGREARRPARRVICAVAVGVAAFIVLEPLVIDTKPGLQVFQAFLITGLWALLMFGGTSGPPAGRK